MMTKRSLLLLAAPALTLSACGGTYNRGVESAHQPVVARADYEFDLSAQGGALAPGEAQRLAGWMDSLRLGYGDHVAVDDPSGSGRLRAQVAGQVARYGLLLSDEAPVPGAPVAPGTVRVVVSRMKANVPGCPDYSRMGQPEFESVTSSNYGCAVNTNLAAMVANPADLVRGEPGSGTADPATAVRAIATYRAATPTGQGGTTSGASAGTAGASK